MSMVFFALIVLGLYCYSELPVQLLPSIGAPYITVQTVYPGTSPEEMERLVTEPIEDAVSSIGGVDDVRSISQEGLSLVIVKFVEGMDEDAAAADVRDRVSAVRAQLPDDAEDPVVAKFDITAMPIMLIGVSAERPSREVKMVVEERVKDRLANVPGVASVSVAGGEEREIQILVDQGRLAALGFSLGDLHRLLAAQNLNLPAGKIKEGRSEYAVRVLGEFVSVDEIRNLTLLSPRGARVRLSEIAEVRDTSADVQTIGRLNGKSSVQLSIQKTSESNTVEVARLVKRELEELKKELPPDFSFGIASDQSIFTEDALHDLRVSLSLGVLLATLVVFFFLRNLPSTFIIFTAIPTSMITTFIPVRLLGFSLNFMTLLGLALAVGILVDDSIVVLENIYRHLGMGKPPAKAAFEGRMEIGLAAVSITMCDVVVFVPIAFVTGIVGQFFRPFALVVAFSTLTSLFVSFTLTPMLASRWLKSADVPEETGEDRVGEAAMRRFWWYVPVLRRAIGPYSRFGTILLGFFALIFAIIVIGPRLGKEFFPRLDQGEAYIFAELPGSARLEETDRVLRQIEDVLRRYPEVETIFTEAGRSMSLRGSQYGQVTIKLIEKAGFIDRLLHPGQRVITIRRGDKEIRKRRRHVQDIADELQRVLASIPGAEIRVRTESRHGTGGVNPLELEITGSDAQAVVETAQRVYEQMYKVPQAIGVDISHKPGKPEIQARIDRVKAAQLGFTVSEIAMALRGAIEGLVGTEYREAGEEYDIRLRLRPEDRVTTEQVENVIIGIRNNQPVRLGDVAVVAPGRGPTQIDHRRGLRMVTISCALGRDESGRIIAQSKLQRLIEEKILNQMVFPPGVRWQWGAVAEWQEESFQKLYRAMLLGGSLIFMVLCALYESWFYPLVIMMTVPMALVGGLLGLIVAGVHLNIMSLIGFMMLLGLVTKNAILLVDYTNTLRRQGFDRQEALLRSGPVRMRPILMTTLTLVFSLLPIVVGVGRGAEIRQPMAAVVTGGMIVSTILTLLVVPAFYTVLDDVQERIYMPAKRLLLRLVFPGRTE